MKKLMTLCSLFFACHLSSPAQNPVPNPSFETWETIVPPYWEDPVGWESTNSLTSGFSATNVKMDSSAHTGVLAAHLATIGHNNQQVIAAMCTGEIIYPYSCSGGFAVSVSYESLEGYYKYGPGVGDSCLVFAMLTKWNEVNDHRDTVAIATFYGDSANSYTLFSTPFNYYIEENPDSAQIIIATSNDSLTPPGGSILLVDDIAFTGSVGIKEIISVPVKIIPNPANETVQLKIPPEMYAGNAAVFDYLGRKVTSVQLTNSQETIATTQFPEGIFLYTIRNDEGTLLASGKFIVKH
jgi:hypothetical protein